jgi:hydroxypyruvate reductase
MAAAVVKKLGKLIHSGVVVAKHEITQWRLPLTINVLYGSHPIPSEKSKEGAAAIFDLVQRTEEDDLIISLISGGGSALVTNPIQKISLVDMEELTTALLRSGAKIQEINTIRKHIDSLKGGGLAKIAGKTQIETLILSDVLGDDLSMIASGPTCGDKTTYFQAMNIIQKYHLEGDIPLSIIKTIQAGMEGEIEETIKPDDPILKNKHNHIIASLSASIKAAKDKAIELGFNTQVISTHLVGEAREIGKIFGSIMRSMDQSDLVLPRPAIMIAGGESTVTVTGRGKGGRNQEIAFGAIEEISGCRQCALVALATDGEDGPTDAAGAYVTGKSFDRAMQMGLNLEHFGSNNDTYTFFEELDNLIKIGPTGTNVNDLLFLFSF